jgi:hypothetical protein
MRWMRFRACNGEEMPTQSPSQRMRALVALRERCKMNKLFRRSKHLFREIAGTDSDVRRISDALAATSTRRRFILPSQSASYNLLSQVVALPAPGNAEDQK